jgi:alpha-L-fucosidase
MSWFETARFGAFVCWGHCSQRGIELSWPMVLSAPLASFCRPMDVDEYHQTAATFDPTQWDPQELAKRIKAAGAQYAVLTAKHHDGFALWRTALSEHSIANTPYGCRGGDLVGEFVEALRAEGLKVGLYFSLADWHHPGYPAFREADKPYRFLTHYPTPESWPSYLEFMFGQVRELLTAYGRIDLLWFDGQWEHTAEEWRARELAAMCRQLQPGILINDRLPGEGEYATFENLVPAQPPEGPWEVCMTMNESWGYNAADPHYKSALELVHTLCEVAGRGGNLLLDLSPRGDGTLPPEQEVRLDAIEGWMAQQGAAIVGTRAALEPWQFYGPATRREYDAGTTLYLHLILRPYASVVVRGVPVRRVKAARLLAKGEALKYRVRTTIENAMQEQDPTGDVTIYVPERLLDPLATIVALEFVGKL